MAVKKAKPAKAKKAAAKQKVKPAAPPAAPVTTPVPAVKKAAPKKAKKPAVKKAAPPVAPATTPVPAAKKEAPPAEILLPNGIKVIDQIDYMRSTDARNNIVELTRDGEKYTVTNSGTGYSRDWESLAKASNDYAVQLNNSHKQ